MGEIEGLLTGLLGAESTVASDVGAPSEQIRRLSDQSAAEGAAARNAVSPSPPPSHCFISVTFSDTRPASFNSTTLRVACSV